MALQSVPEYLRREEDRGGGRGRFCGFGVGGGFPGSGILRNVAAGCFNSGLAAVRGRFSVFLRDVCTRAQRFIPLDCEELNLTSGVTIKKSWSQFIDQNDFYISKFIKASIFYRCSS